ncbi:MAG: preprotein translocase subunit SecG [Phycisphaerales bacterium]|jgi:preprotein translocase subunit SecG
MTVLPLLAVGILMNLVAFLFFIVSVLLILVVLIQKGRGGGLSGAFGGGMASGLLGSKTGDFLTWVTIGMVVVFLGLAVLLARFYRPSVSEYGEPAAPTTQSAPATTEQKPAPAAPANQPAPAPAAPAAAPQQQAPATEAPAAQPQPAGSGATDAGQPAQGAATGATGGK